MAADWQGVVSSIVIVDTLIDDYLREVRLMSGGARDEETFKSHVGAANRIYPAIWDHLDTAHGLVSAGGRDVPLFDVIRQRIGNSTHEGLVGYDTKDWQI